MADRAAERDVDVLVIGAGVYDRGSRPRYRTGVDKDEISLADAEPR